MLIKVGILEEKEEQIGPTVGYVLVSCSECGVKVLYKLCRFEIKRARYAVQAKRLYAAIFL